MIVALLLALSVASWVPARWRSSDPNSLEIVGETPVNCLLLEREHWSEKFAAQAAKRDIATLGVIRPGGDAAAQAREAMARKLSGIVLEGDFEEGLTARVRDSLTGAQAVLIELRPRWALRWDQGAPVVGTYQGLWPGIQIQKDGAAKAAPTGGPWIDTNSGFLRFLRAAVDAPIWIAYDPPPKSVITQERYLQAIADAAINGARWIVSLDADFERRLLERQERALATWRLMGTYLRYFEEHRDWVAGRPHGRLALIQDADSGALLSGSILDMVAVKHTPVRAVPRWKLSPGALEGARMAVNVDPESLSPEQKEVLRAFTRSGGTLLSGPPGWRFPATARDQITLAKEDVERLDEIWRGVNSLVGRSNLGVRLFNVASMLSNLLETPGGQVVLHLVNYSGYPVEHVTAHFLGRYKKARLYSPEAPPRELELYDVEGATAVDIPEVRVCATVVLE
ncbi:MAG: hypothetical protein RMK57_04675 [Bryobacterales bacterium]|nr:hypothetical protein [Bryobacteraceae bacterium]MDW8353806.1 hypothetical protein [Bryobacterales bacterium]